MDKQSLRISLIVVFLVTLAATITLVLSSDPSMFLVMGLIVIAVLLGLVVILHARHTLYVCPSCGLTFRASALADSLSPHYPHKKLLGCAGCGETNWCRVTVK